MEAPRNTAVRSFASSSFLLRIAASIFFIPCFIIITMRGGYHYLALVDIIILIGTWEFYKMMELKGIRPYKAIGLVCALALSWYFFFRNGVYANLFLTLMLMTLMGLELTRKDGTSAIYHIATTILGIMYVSYLASHLLLLRELPISIGREYELGSSFVFLVYLVTWSGDTMAYIVGVLIGRRPLLPRVSGKKTWEGSIAGLAASVAGALIARATFAPYLQLWHALVLGVSGGVVAQLGDLFESMIKRDASLKDASSTIPGHGGVLDRFDGLLFSAPFIYYFLKYVVF
ncbi:MAG: phosphatidate cytidylyltransferase [Chitinivibrionia bacterium]|nr:phosphatidate cytidylyltransferase [Chitinivibrionia bacterium]